MNHATRSTLVAFITALLLTPLAAVSAEDITAAAFGDIHDTSDGGVPAIKGGGFSTPPSGDTWYTTWAGDDTLYVNVDDGLGFEDPGNKHIMLRNCLCMLTGNPNESTDGFRGVNLNPGLRGTTIPNNKFDGLQGYTSSIYEQDGILYQIRHAWSQEPLLWPPIDSSMIKSSDGGRNWGNHLGQKNAPLPNGANAMFSSLPWSWFTFVQYGKGGAAPAVDGARQYVYLTASDCLARVPREKLAGLNKADFQYYKGAPLDGMLDTSWSDVPAEAGKIGFSGSKVHITNVVYNFALQRYVATGTKQYKAPKSPEFSEKMRFEIYTAEHPWGPWAETMSYGIWGRAGWNMLMANKFTSGKGRKMWYVFCGEYKGDLWYYGFQYMPLYLSTGPVDIYEAETARLVGARTAAGYPACSGSGYIENFSRPGDRAVFELNNVNGTGWHIVRIRYTSPKVNGSVMSIYVNGRKAKRVKFSENSSDGAPGLSWTDRSDVYYLKSGVNTFEIRQDQGDSAPSLMIDYVAVSREPTYDEGVNIAPEATASASSGEAAKAISGCARDEASEWSAAGAQGEWIRLDWNAPKTIGMVRLYDKLNMRDQVMSGTLSFSDGSTLPVGRLQNDGQAATVIAFPPKTVTWAKLTIDKVRSGTVHAGLGQFEAYVVRGPESRQEIAPSAAAPAQSAAAKAVRSWTKTTVPDTENCCTIVFDQKNPQRIILGTRPSGVFESLDAGATWTAKKTPMPSSLRVGFNPGSMTMNPQVPATWFAGVERNGAFRSRDNGVTWQQVKSGLDIGGGLNGIAIGFDPQNADLIYYGSDGGMFKSTDGGDHWTKCTRGLPSGKGENTTVLRIVVDPRSGAVYAGFYAVVTSGQAGVYKSTDRGETWHAVNNGIETGPDEAILKEMRDQQKRLATAKTEGDLAYHGSFLPQKAWTFDLQMSPADPNVLFAATQGGLYRTQDGGGQWRKCEGIVHPKSIAFDPRNPDVVAVGTLDEVWLSRDGGQKWRNVSAGLNIPPKSAKPPMIIDMGNGLKGTIREMTDTFNIQQLVFDPSGQRLFALATQGLWVADAQELK